MVSKGTQGESLTAGTLRMKWGCMHLKDVRGQGSQGSPSAASVGKVCRIGLQR